VSHTRRCGWVDWVYALPTAAAGLIARMRARSDPALALTPGLLLLSGQPAFALRYGLTSGALGVKVQLAQDYAVARNLAPADRWGAALGIFMPASVGLVQ